MKAALLLIVQGVWGNENNANNTQSTPTRTEPFPV